MDDRSRMILRQVAQIATDMGPALAPSGHDELLRSVASAARSLFGAAACSLAILDEENNELVFHVASGVGEEDIGGMRMPANRGIAGWVLTSGQGISIEDVARDPRFASDVAASTGYVPRSIIAMPMETERAVIGVIEVLDRTGEERSGTRDMELLGLFADQAALAIENSRVFSQLGAALFGALEGAADGDLREALHEFARRPDTPNPNLARLAAHFHALGQMGEEEHSAATRLLGEFLHYASQRRGWT